MLTVSYSGLSHFCFWQCSESRLTGSFPVHDAPPIICLTVGLGGPAASLLASSDRPLSEFDGPLRDFLGSLVELVKTILSPKSCSFVPDPDPPALSFPFLTILNLYRVGLTAGADCEIPDRLNYGQEGEKTILGLSLSVYHDVSWNSYSHLPPHVLGLLKNSATIRPPTRFSRRHNVNRVQLLKPNPRRLAGVPCYRPCHSGRGAPRSLPPPGGGGSAAASDFIGRQSGLSALRSRVTHLLIEAVRWSCSRSHKATMSASSTEFQSEEAVAIEKAGGRAADPDAPQPSPGTASSAAASSSVRNACKTRDPT